MLHQYAHIKSLKSQRRESQGIRRKNTLVSFLPAGRTGGVTATGEALSGGAPPPRGSGEIQREKGPTIDLPLGMDSLGELHPQKRHPVLPIGGWE